MLLGLELPFSCISTVKGPSGRAHPPEGWLEAHSWLEVSFTDPCRKMRTTEWQNLELS